MDLALWKPLVKTPGEMAGVEGMELCLEWLEMRVGAQKIEAASRHDSPLEVCCREEQRIG